MAGINSNEVSIYERFGYIWNLCVECESYPAIWSMLLARYGDSLRNADQRLRDQVNAEWMPAWSDNIWQPSPVHARRVNFVWALKDLIYNPPRETNHDAESLQETMQRHNVPDGVQEDFMRSLNPATH